MEAIEHAASTTLTIRNVDRRLKERLRVRAAQHGQSMEAELRQILRDTLEVEQPPELRAWPRTSALIRPDQNRFRTARSAERRLLRPDNSFGVAQNEQRLSSGVVFHVNIAVNSLLKSCLMYNSMKLT